MINKEVIYIIINDMLENEGLNSRDKSVIKHTYGLSSDKRQKTLQWIGDKYDISRERVRQIKENILKKLRGYKKKNQIEKELMSFQKWLKGNGVVMDTETLLEEMNEDRRFRNALRFLADVTDREFISIRGETSSDEFNERWYPTVDADFVDCLETSLQKLHKKVSKSDTIATDNDLVELFKQCMDDKIKNHFNEDNFVQWLMITKKLKKNNFGYWGHSNSPFVKFNSTKHRLIHILRDKQEAQHFKDLWKQMNKQFNCNVCASTCHNELIKSPDFVWVGMGKYGLQEWGDRIPYGTVRERIMRYLEKNDSATKEEIIDAIKANSDVKTNTIINALYDKNCFTKKDGSKWCLSK